MENSAPVHPTPTVGLITDFGTADVYVGVMKSVILRGRPGASLVDLTHEVAPGDILGGALALEAALGYLPEGAVALAVIDPGVGSGRHALVAEADGRFLVGPDNGLLGPALKSAASARVYRASGQGIDRARRACGIAGRAMSATFHGRDVFAPLAASLAGRLVAESLGDPAGEWTELDLPEATADGLVVLGEVVHVDRFGNLVTSIRREQAARATLENSRVEIRGSTIRGVRRTYSDVAPGETIALVGSTDRLEISVRSGSAAEVLGASRGTKVLLNLEHHR